jgi:hypothetical protein
MMILPLVLLAVAFAAGTWWLGWWAVPLVALAYGVWRARRSPDARRAPAALLVGITAAATWALLLAASAASAPVAELARGLAAVMGQPAPVLYLATVLFPMLLAWSAAAFGESAVTRRRASASAEPAAIRRSA